MCDAYGVCEFVLVYAVCIMCTVYTACSVCTVCMVICMASMSCHGVYNMREVCMLFMV